LSKRLRKRFSLLVFVFCANWARIAFELRGGIMLKGIPPFLTADLLWILAAMGHGDELAVVDRNFSADRVARKTASGRLIVLPGIDAPTAIGGILQVLPLDTFVDQPVSHMGPADRSDRLLEVHGDVQTMCAKAEGRTIISKPIERFAYYPLAEACFAVVQTAEARPYANFILKKGVIQGAGCDLQASALSCILVASDMMAR
jgi:L-fucose mutarotase